MAQMRHFVVALYIVSAILHMALGQSEFSVQDRQILLNGDPFVVKGVNYSPLPPGTTPAEYTEWGDVFHRDFNVIHTRDLELMRTVGVNNIRVYQILLAYPNTNTPLDHGAFLDICWNNGENPVYVWLTYALHANWDYVQHASQPATGYAFQTLDGSWWSINQDTDQQRQIDRDVQRGILVEIANRYGNHPAVIGFVLGNEQNNAVNRANCMYWQWIEQIANEVKSTAPTKLTATSIVDDGMVTVNYAEQCGTVANNLEHLEVWGINSYRGTVNSGFDNLFSSYATASTRPLIITEYGVPSSTRNSTGDLVQMPNNSEMQGQYLKSHWDDMMAHSAICAGGFAFTWVDEWWKAGYIMEQNPTLAPNGAFPGGWADEEYFGIIAVAPDCTQLENFRGRVDPARPKGAYYYLGLMFGAYTELPAEALIPIDYNVCRRDWAPPPPIDERPPVPELPPVSGTVQPLPVPPPSVINIPGVIEGAFYSTFSDTTVGNQGGFYRNDAVDISNCTDDYEYTCACISVIEPNEWLQYNLNVQQQGKYSLVARAAFPDDAPAGVNRHIRVSIDGQEVGTILLYAGGDYNDWQNSNAFITDVLTTGQHSLTLNFIEAYWRMRLIFAELADGTPSTNTPTNSNTPTSNSPSEGNVPTTGNVTPISDITPTTQNKPGNSMASSVSISISFVLALFVSILS
jgi:hypothetical protein